MRSLTEVATDSGITTRQLDHWQRRGLVRARFFDKATDEELDEGGTGTRMRFDRAEQVKIRWLAKLVADGFQPEAAAPIAAAFANGQTLVQLPSGITVGR